MVKLDRKNVVVSSYRPIGSERRGLAIMHGIVAAQMRKQRPPGVVLIEFGVADVDRIKLARLHLSHRFFSSVAALRAIGEWYDRQRSGGQSKVAPSRPGNPATLPRAYAHFVRWQQTG